MFNKLFVKYLNCLFHRTNMMQTRNQGFSNRKAKGGQAQFGENEEMSYEYRPSDNYLL